MFKKLCKLGPSYGYHSGPSKDYCGGDEDDVGAAAAACFPDMDHHFLGGFIGDEEHIKSYVHEKMKDWVPYVLKLAEAAENQYSLNGPSCM